MPTLTLRPIADTNKFGIITYTSGTSAYTMISEVVADDSTTVINFQSATIVGSLLPTTSSIKCQLTNSININYRVSAVRVYVRWYHESGTNSAFDVGIVAENNLAITVARPSVPTAFETQIFSMPASLITQINNGAKQLYLYISCTEKGDSKVIGKSSVTQAYVEIDYTEVQTITYCKIEGVPKQVTTTYCKIDGAWKVVPMIYYKILNGWRSG